MHEEKFESRIRNQFSCMISLFVARIIVYSISHMSLSADAPIFTGLISVLGISVIEITLILSIAKLFQTFEFLNIALNQYRFEQ
mmetsp:Transcript_1909/g.1821  ORF Transcript_1909/g.1821 Transcript_1909/m.1821 type:complete len:84 (+) Transcript_1909:221-472(+)